MPQRTFVPGKQQCRPRAERMTAAVPDLRGWYWLPDPEVCLFLIISLHQLHSKEFIIPGQLLETSNRDGTFLLQNGEVRKY
jgi:hypothetical protein